MVGNGLGLGRADGCWSAQSHAYESHIKPITHFDRQCSGNAGEDAELMFGRGRPCVKTPRHLRVVRSELASLSAPLIAQSEQLVSSLQTRHARVWPRPTAREHCRGSVFNLSMGLSSE